MKAFHLLISSFTVLISTSASLAGQFQFKNETESSFSVQVYDRSSKKWQNSQTLVPGQSWNCNVSGGQLYIILWSGKDEQRHIGWRDLGQVAEKTVRVSQRKVPHTVTRLVQEVVMKEARVWNGREYVVKQTQVTVNKPVYETVEKVEFDVGCNCSHCKTKHGGKYCGSHHTTDSLSRPCDCQHCVTQHGGQYCASHHQEKRQQ